MLLPYRIECGGDVAGFVLLVLHPEWFIEDPAWSPGPAEAADCATNVCLRIPCPQTNQDFVVEMELLDPPKGPSLAWLEGTAPAPPPRYARVTVIRGSKADCMDYKVSGVHTADRPASDDFSYLFCASTRRRRRHRSSSVSLADLHQTLTGLFAHMFESGVCPTTIANNVSMLPASALALPPSSESEVAQAAVIGWQYLEKNLGACTELL